jgi:ABC-2 type transport system ATP-binding protein
VATDGTAGLAALETTDLTKRYDDGTLALDSLDLTIPGGSFFGLLGPNGAGKTTLINSITGLVRVSSGSIRVFGHQALGEGVEALAARRLVGLSPQDVNLDRFLTVYESLLYHGGYYGLPRSVASQRAEEMIDVFDLRAKRDTRTPRLSGGMKRRLLLARALVHQPRLVILDEPTAGVDYELRLELWRYIRLLHERGTTILLTTHYLEEAEELCEQIALIRDGCVVALDSPTGLRDLYEADSLGEVYVKAVGARPDHVEVP